MIVYTYFNPLVSMDVGKEHELVVLWQKSCRRVELEPLILTHQHAEAHPRFTEFDKLARSFPSINPPGYDLACWHRWLAFDVVGGGLLTDYDVIWNHFSPELLALPNDVTVLDRGGVPCAVYATAEGAAGIVESILNSNHTERGASKKHYSDMIWFQSMGFEKAPEVTAPFGAPGYKDAPAVHCSHADIGRERPGKDRISVVRNEFNLGTPMRLAA